MGSLALLRQINLEKGNSDFKPVVLRLQYSPSVPACPSRVHTINIQKITSVYPAETCNLFIHVLI